MVPGTWNQSKELSLDFISMFLPLPLYWNSFVNSEGPVRASLPLTLIKVAL